MIIAGIIGSLSVFLFSGFLSQLTFGNNDFTISFQWVAISVFFSQISNGYLTIIRGMRKLKLLAIANVLGSVTSLFVSVPLYFIFGVDGIVPTVILTSGIGLMLVFTIYKKVGHTFEWVPLKRMFTLSKQMVSMGFVLSLSGLYVFLKNYFLRLFINSHGGLDEVGLYTAAFTLMDGYLALIFSSMGTDYFPRLVAESNNVDNSNRLINQQAEIALIILAPLIAIFIVYGDIILSVLYSDKFVPAQLMLQWAFYGTIFKATSWSIAFLILARGESRIFALSEFIAGTITFTLHLFGYYIGGLTGIGIGFCLGYVYYNFHVLWLTTSRYDFKLSTTLLKLFFTQLLLSSTLLIFMNILSNPWNIFFGTLVALIIFIYSVIQLNNRIGLKNLLRKFLKKAKKH